MTAPQLPHRLLPLDDVELKHQRDRRDSERSASSQEPKVLSNLMFGVHIRNEVKYFAVDFENTFWPIPYVNRKDCSYNNAMSC